MNDNYNGDIEIIEDSSFSYEGFEVVRGEYFSHIYEPSFTFNGNKAYVNTACIRKITDFDYIMISVNREKKLLAVIPCNEDEKDSFRWCSATSRRSPKQINCPVFIALVMKLMNWNPIHRYKLLGKLIRTPKDLLFVFDLETAEIYIRNISNDGKITTSKKPYYPEEWGTHFGVPLTEHKSSIQMSTFEGYTVFGLDKRIEAATKTKARMQTRNNTNIESEKTDETKNSQLSIFEIENSFSTNRYKKQSDSYSQEHSCNDAQANEDTILNKPAATTDSN